jgi:hypothetical protein
MATKKASPAKATAKPKKAAAPAKTVKKAAPKAKAVTEEDIRKKAEELYYARIKKGVHGTSDEDWLKAEKLLKGKK